MIPFRSRHCRLKLIQKLRSNIFGCDLRADVPEVGHGEGAPVAAPHQRRHPHEVQLVEEGGHVVGGRLAGLQVLLVRDLVREAVEEEHDGGDDEVHQVQGEGSVDVAVHLEVVRLGPLLGARPQLHRAAHGVQQPEYELGARGDATVPSRNVRYSVKMSLSFVM